MTNYFHNKKIYDISPTISPQLGVFPGDVGFQLNTSIDFKKGDHLKVSSMTTTLHLGAHADAPNHYHPVGEDMAQRSLHYYLGPCQVVEAQRVNSEGRLLPENLDEVEIQAPRILFKTGSFPDPYKWNSDFYSLSVELIERLAEKKVILVGIDTPSVDPQKSKDLPAHQCVYQNQMAILEGLVLEPAPSGLYELIALPLALQGADASPVRAILLK